MLYLQPQSSQPSSGRAAPARPLQRAPEARRAPREPAPDAAYLFEWPLLIACVAWLVTLRRGSSGLILVLPAAVAVLLAAPMLLIGFFADGVANLPVQALVAGLIAGLVAPARVGASRRLFAGDGSE